MTMLYTCILIVLDRVSQIPPRTFALVPDDRLFMKLETLKTTVSTIDYDTIAEIAYQIGKLVSVGAWVPSRSRLQCSDNNNNNKKSRCNLSIMHGPFTDPDLVCVTIVLCGQKDLLGLFPDDNDDPHNDDSRIILTNNDALVHDYRQTAHYIDVSHHDCTTLTLFYRKCKKIRRKWTLFNIWNYFSP